MRLSRDKLILLGVAALYEAAEHVTAEPMQLGLALRAVLAMFYQLSDGDRTAFDGYWRALRDPSGVDHPQREYLRGTLARTAIEGILRSLGGRCRRAAAALRQNRALHGPGRPYEPHDAKIAHLLRERSGGSD
jgi:uncharacterized protein (DUF2236 family)